MDLNVYDTENKKNRYKNHVFTQRLFYFLKGFFDSVDFRLNRVGRRDKTAQSLVFSEKSLQIRLMMESGI